MSAARLVVAALLCVALAFGALQPTHEGSSAAPVVNPTPDAIVQLVAVGPAGKMQNRACAATGFLINEEGYLVTNAHVVEDAQRCLASAPGAKMLAKLTPKDARSAQAVPCDLVGIDTANDLAILKTERPILASSGGSAPYMVLDTDTLAVGTAVSVAGYPTFSWQPVSQSGSVTRVGATALEGIDGSSPALSDAVGIDIRLQPGNSGSPVYREGGKVVAVINQRDRLRPAYSVAVAIHYAVSLANRYGVRWHGAQ